MLYGEVGQGECYTILFWQDQKYRPPSQKCYKEEIEKSAI